MRLIGCLWWGKLTKLNLTMGISSKLASAKREAVYFDNQVEYLSTLDDRQPNIGQGEDKPPQTPLYIKPFAFELTPTQFIRENATAARWTTYKAEIGNRAVDTVADTAKIIPFRGFTPARIVIKTGVGAKQVKTSKSTKRKYVSRGGTSGSIPFGNNGTETEQEAYDAIYAALIAKIGTANETIKLSRIKENY